MGRKGIATLLIVALLCALFVQLDWQAAGNMTNELPIIRMYMDAGIEAGLVDQDMAVNISDSCNAQWDEFWNVGVVNRPTELFDAVIYGYAFRAHWYWHNNYGPNLQSFLIWKDYNCITKQTVLFPNFIEGNTADLTAPVRDSHVSDINIWQWTKNAMDLYHQAMADDLVAGQTDKVAVAGLFVDTLTARVSVRVCCLKIDKVALTSPAGVFAVAFVMRSDQPEP